MDCLSLWDIEDILKSNSQEGGIPLDITHDNHYVPQWYQQYFLDGKNKFYYCDLSPSRIDLPDGSHRYHNNLSQKGKANCFVQKDLYTMYFGNIDSDIIERKFFDSREKLGYKAWPIFLSEGWGRGYPESWRSVLEFMDSQWFRTPKGMAFVKEVIQANKMPFTTNTILNTMMKIHRFHCTIWAECIWEIVSAENSSVKFLLTDHPITLYHPLYLPKMFPHDPHPWQIGTQVVYPLTLDKCLILTHLQNVRQPENLKLLRPRENGRAYSMTIKNVAEVIRNRQLTEDNVIHLNYLLKSRAWRYIAEIEKNWLYPEKQWKGMWQDIRVVLLPDKNKNVLAMAGGDVFVGFEDGSSIALDEFGRPLPVDASSEISKMKNHVDKLIKNKFAKSQH